MAINDSDKHYATRNTALAAYLYSEGFPLADVEIHTHPHYPEQTIATFIFESSKELLQHERLFQHIEAVGNIVLFHEAYRKCLRMCKVGKF